jgi:hypothetical protein
LSLFFREGHGAEKILFRRAGIFRVWLLGMRMLRLRLGVLWWGRRHIRARALITRTAILLVATGLVPARIVPAGFIAAGLVPAGFITTRFIAALIALRRRHHLARRLDAAERAAEFIDLAFISELLTLGQFHKFQNLIQLVDRMLELLGDFGRVQDGLMDGRGGGRTEISGLGPLPGTFGFRAAFRTLGAFRPIWSILAILSFRRAAARDFARKIAGYFALWRRGGGFLGRLGGGRFHGFTLVRGKVGGCFGMRLTITAGVLGLGGFRGLGVLVNGLAGFRGVGNIFGGRGGFLRRRTRTAGAATATATATAAVDGASRRGGRL